jgi:hypothetical protein
MAAGLIPALVSAALVGCSGSGAEPTAPGQGIVKGKLVDRGKPFTLDPAKVPLPKGVTGIPPGSNTSVLEIIFISTTDGVEHPAVTNAEAGTFEVKGPGDKGIPPGRYKIVVTARYGSSDDTPDYFKGRYTPEKTQIIRDVKPGEEVVIDISKPEG